MTTQKVTSLGRELKIQTGQNYGFSKKHKIDNAIKDYTFQQLSANRAGCRKTRDSTSKLRSTSFQWMGHQTFNNLGDPETSAIQVIPPPSSDVV